VAPPAQPQPLTQEQRYIQTTVSNLKTRLCANMQKKMAEDVAKKLLTLDEKLAANQVKPMTMRCMPAATLLPLCCRHSSMYSRTLACMLVSGARRTLVCCGLIICNAQVSAEVCTQFAQWCQAMERNDVATAGSIQTALTSSVWDEHGSWLQATKRLVDQAKKG
jgi:hypothetical protein